MSERERKREVVTLRMVSPAAERDRSESAAREKEDDLTRAKVG